MLLWYLFLLVSGFCKAGSFLEHKIDYWSEQRKGANVFNNYPRRELFDAARDSEIAFVRLAADKWEGKERDFLLGDADSFKQIPLSDINKLRSLLDYAELKGVKVVLTLLSLPGSRWRQHNNGKDDLRLWLLQEYREQALAFWKSLAGLLKDHPALVGYNILNEPHPEVLSGKNDYTRIDFKEWGASVKGSLKDLNLFYKDMVEAIREVDKNTPIVLDTGMYATPWALEYLIPLKDEKVLYSFHMYEPFIYTNGQYNKGRFSYPGVMPLSFEEPACNSKQVFWDKQALKKFFEPVAKWQQRFNIPSSRILVGEFGCDRLAHGAAQYLADLIEIFNGYNWHWAFYAFREDGYAAMDYELGTAKTGAAYWEAFEKGECLDRFRRENPLWIVLREALGKK